MKNYILVIDEGTTGVRAVIFDRSFKIVGQAYEVINVVYPGENKVEQSADEIYEKSVAVCRQVVKDTGISASDIECVGITTQRTTWGIWDKDGKPIRNMVVWQDSRGEAQKERFKNDPLFAEKLPMIAPIIDYLPGLYVPLVIEDIKANEPEFKARLAQKDVLWGTVDAWLVYKLTNGKVHATCPSNASASSIYLTQYGVWFKDFVEYVGLDSAALPQILEEADDYGMMSADILGVEIPITGVVADQQSALFSQGCLEANTAKCTNGTGSFFDVNIGGEYKEVPGFTSMVAWRLGGKTTYLVEGYTLTAGAALEWTKNNLKAFSSFDKMNEMAVSVPDNGGVYFVPALVGLATPYQDYTARASFMGISASTSIEHFVRAVLESVAFSVADNFDVIKAGGYKLDKISISGGASKSDLVAQLMANTTGAQVMRPASIEATALGAAQFAAIKRGIITADAVPGMIEIDKTFNPDGNAERDVKCLGVYKKAVARSLKWLE